MFVITRGYPVHHKIYKWLHYHLKHLKSVTPWVYPWTTPIFWYDFLRFPWYLHLSTPMPMEVMELLEGPDLFDFLAARSSKLEEVKAVGLVRPARAECAECAEHKMFQ